MFLKRFLIGSYSVSTLLFFVLVYCLVSLNHSTILAEEKVMPEYIQTLGQAGYIQSHASLEAYNLDTYILRQEALGVSIKVSGTDRISVCNEDFSDVSETYPNTWVCPLVSQALEEGRISDANTLFRPEETLSRSEALAMLLFPSCSGEIYERDRDRYVFSNDLSDWQKRIVVLALNNSIISETDETDWNAPITREEFFWWTYQVHRKKPSCFRHKGITYYHDYASYPKSIRIDTFREKVSYYEHGEKIGSFIASTGNNDFATPSGRFKITNKHPKMLSSSAGLWMPNWMEFYKGTYGIHALPVTYSGVQVRDESVLGKSAPGGCVRLSQTDAQELYNWADIETTVLIHYNDLYEPR